MKDLKQLVNNFNPVATNNQMQNDVVIDEFAKSIEGADEEIKELQKAEFEELSKKGEISCLTDLFINAGL